ncbi:hypothetical protein H4R20_002864 [Coemansia guatemalensis]|uniref:Uncharacterized protein n=1 Tax=Coemansia guatemalensis TaxID=2761395 RepID=A0A9W8HUS0_9FUNG|nr:hypothetical protein H4R20_002864 [Coemansia guatemalensis]
MMVHEDGTVARASGDLHESTEAFALSSLMKDSAELVAMIRPEATALTRVTISRQSDTTIVATPYQKHIFCVKLAGP